MKYKVGDKVRIKDDSENKYTYTMCNVCKPVKKYRGKITTITEVVQDYYYHIDLDGGRDWWTNEMLESVNDNINRKIVEIIIDLVNYDEPKIKCRNIEEETEEGYLTEGSCIGFRREAMQKPYINGTLHYFYLFITDEDDYNKIVDSKETKDAIEKLYELAKKDICHYQKELDLIKEQFYNNGIYFYNGCEE